MFKGVKQQSTDTCIFASVSGVMKDLDSKKGWSEPRLVHRYRELGGVAPSFGDLIKILGSELEACGFRLKQVTSGDYPAAKPYLTFLRQCLKEGIKPILSREVFYAKQFGGSWHMLTLLGESSEGFSIYDTAGGLMHILEDELMGSFKDLLGRMSKIHHGFDTLIVSRV